MLAYKLVIVIVFSLGLHLRWQQRGAHNYKVTPNLGKSCVNNVLNKVLDDLTVRIDKFWRQFDVA